MDIKPVYAMAICPHADDAEFGAAGTIASWTKQGKDVVYIVCTNGDKGTSDYNMKPEHLAAIREKEQLAAAQVLGVKDVVFLRHPDQALEDTPELRKEIVKVIRTYRPEIVLCPNPYRRYVWHRDHRVTGQVTLDAIYPYARDHLAYPDLLKQGYQPHKVKEVWLWATLEDINWRIDITGTFDIKLAALRCHESQVGADFPETKQWLRERARQMAEGESFELAEAFHREEITW